MLSLCLLKEDIFQFFQIYFPQEALMHASEGQASEIKSSESANMTIATSPSSLRVIMQICFLHISHLI